MYLPKFLFNTWWIHQNQLTLDVFIKKKKKTYSRCIYPNFFITLGGYIKINLICVPKQYARKKQPDIFVLPANTDHILFIK